MGDKTTPEDTSSSGEFLNDRLRNEIVNEIKSTDAKPVIPFKENPMPRVALALVLVLGISVAIGATIYGARTVAGLIPERAGPLQMTHDDFDLAVGHTFDFLVHRNGAVLGNARLELVEEEVLSGNTYYKVRQSALGTEEFFYWTVNDEGFYQYFQFGDVSPQFHFPLPMKAGDSWDLYCFTSRGRAKEGKTTLVRFRATREQRAKVEAGSLKSIRIDATEDGDNKPTQIWVSPEGPIAKLLLDANDPSFYAEFVGSNRTQ